MLQKVLSQEITQKSTLKSTKKRTLAGEYSEKYSKKYWKKCVKKHSRRTELKKVLQKVQEKILKKVLPSVSTLGRKVTLTEKCITNLEEAFIANKALEQIKCLSATTEFFVFRQERNKDIDLINISGFMKVHVVAIVRNLAFTCSHACEFLSLRETYSEELKVFPHDV